MTYEARRTALPYGRTGPSARRRHQSGKYPGGRMQAGAGVHHATYTCRITPSYVMDPFCPRPLPFADTHTHTHTLREVRSSARR